MGRGRLVGDRPGLDLSAGNTADAHAHGDRNSDADASADTTAHAHAHADATAHAHAYDNPAADGHPESFPNPCAKLERGADHPGHRIAQPHADKLTACERHAAAASLGARAHVASSIGISWPASTVRLAADPKCVVVAWTTVDRTSGFIAYPSCGRRHPARRQWWSRIGSHRGHRGTRWTAAQRC